MIQQGSSPQGHDNEVLVYDLSFEANEALWDRYMLSSIPYTGSRPAWSGSDPLLVGRYRFNGAAANWSRDLLAQRLADESGASFRRAAEFLVNEGAFNINSTSVEAWKALLGSMRGLERPGLDGAKGVGEHPLARSLLPGMAGSSAINSQAQEELWSGFRSLSDDEIGTLAESIVEQVRERGPLLSVSDFVNRRLVDDRDTSRGGALDGAIADARVFNSRLERAQRTEVRDVGEVTTAENRPAGVLAGLPGYFSQGDLLAGLAPAITARGDTFRVRAYGESRSSWPTLRLGQDRSSFHEEERHREVLFLRGQAPEKSEGLFKFRLSHEAGNHALDEEEPRLHRGGHQAFLIHACHPFRLPHRPRSRRP
jgi:hypothetical protein